MQPQDPIQPTQPNAMPVSPELPVPPMPVAPAPLQAAAPYQPVATPQQPAAPQVFGAPAPMQPPVAPGFGAPMQPQTPLPPMGGGMSMLGMKGGRSRKKILLPVVVLLVAVGAFFALSFFKDPYPKYKAPTEISFADHKVTTFTDWVKKEDNEGTMKTLTYTDYVTDEAGKNIHAAHAVIVNKSALPKSFLTAESKEKIIEQYTKDSFFSTLRTGLDGCLTVESKESSSTDATTVKNAFVVIDFSFVCKESEKYAQLNALGRLIVSNEGSLSISIMGARKQVYEKNKTSIDKAARSIYKD